MTGKILSGAVGALAVLAAGLPTLGGPAYAGVRWTVDWTRVCAEGDDPEECVLTDVSDVGLKLAERFAPEGGFPVPIYATQEDCRRGTRQELTMFERLIGARGLVLDVGCRPVPGKAGTGPGWNISQATLVGDLKVPEEERCPAELRGRRTPLPDLSGPGLKVLVECPREKPDILRLVVTMDTRRGWGPVPQYDTREDCQQALRLMMEDTAGWLSTIAGEESPESGARTLEVEGICSPAQ